MAASRRKRNVKDRIKNCSEVFELEPIMHFEEFTFEQSTKMLSDAGFNLSAEEVAELMLFLNTIAKVTLKEIFSTK
jgi:hypothetical protein